MGRSKYSMWVENQKQTKEQKLGTELKALLADMFSRKNVKGSNVAQAKYLGFKNTNTYVSRINDPGSFSLRELWGLVEEFELTSEQVGKFMGCKR